MNARKIKRIIKGRKAIDGAGVRLVRVLGHDDIYDIDPFLMMDAFDSNNPDDYTRGFPWHPHRGIETITYLIKGEIEHGDSLGNQGTISDGDCQWMTAGSGIIHQEMPLAAPRILGAQVWLNLPVKDKMTTPAYNDLKSSDIKEVVTDEAKVRIVAGTYQGIKGSFEGHYVKPLYLDVELKPNAKWELEIEQDNTVLVYIFEGHAIFEEESDEIINDKQALLFGEGNKIYVETRDSNVRFILLAGKPLKEPIAWAGPIVMNTEEELVIAFAEIDNNTFVK